MSAIFCDINEECKYAILNALKIHDLAKLRGSCKFWYNVLDPITLWEWLAEKYCELYPPYTRTERYVRSEKSSLAQLTRVYGHLYDIEWNARSLAAWNRKNATRNGARIGRPWWLRSLGSIKAEFVPKPPDSLEELIAVCVLRERYVEHDELIKKLKRENNKFYKSRVVKKAVWNQWWKFGGNEDLNERWAISPLSGKPIRKDGPSYQKLVENGYF